MCENGKSHESFLAVRIAYVWRQCQIGLAFQYAVGHLSARSHGNPTGRLNLLEDCWAV
jgi:hypothetical protein